MDKHLDISKIVSVTFKSKDGQEFKAEILDNIMTVTFNNPEQAREYFYKLYIEQLNNGSWTEVK